MSSSSSKKMIVLKCPDGEFEIEEAVALQSQTIKHMIEDDCADNIPIPNVNAPVLSKVIEYLKHHVSVAADDDAPANNAADAELKKFDDEFVKVDQPMLFDLILAANYLHIKELLDLLCQTVADMINGKTPEQIRATFNIENDFTPEEEAEVREQNKWAFE